MMCDVKAQQEGRRRRVRMENGIEVMYASARKARERRSLSLLLDRICRAFK